jgi:hypothetical protein
MRRHQQQLRQRLRSTERDSMRHGNWAHRHVMPLRPSQAVGDDQSGGGGGGGGDDDDDDDDDEIGGRDDGDGSDGDDGCVRCVRAHAARTR